MDTAIEQQKLEETRVLRDALKHQIKEAKNIHSIILRESAIEQLTKNAMFKLAHLWLGDI